MPRAAQRDPRSIITPDAFEVSAALVGTPLALPSRRLAALIIDGVVVMMISALTRSVPLLIGVAAAALFIRASTKRTQVRGSVFGRAMRLSVGCLGLLIAVVTAGLWASFGIDFDRERAGVEVAATAGQVLRGLTAAGALVEAESRDEAVEIAGGLIQAGEDLGVSRADLRTSLLAAVPDTVEWADEWVAAVDSLLDAGERPGRVQGDERVGVSAEVEASLAAMTDAEVLSRFVELGEREELSGAERALLPALRARAMEIVAADTLGALERRVERLRSQSENSQERLDEAEAELAATRDRGFFRWILDLAEGLGFGFGWLAIYMTVVLSWWNGQTVGKRAMGIRVVRLDGEPINWWVAFERVGGYAAGFATGLLGFAQVWWDANRQAIHDRIVGTVVVVDGADKVLDWESAL